MKEKATLGLVIALLAMGALVDFTSAILSLLADTLLLGGAGAFGWFVLRDRIAKDKAQATRIADLEQQVRGLRIQLADRPDDLAQFANQRR